MELDRIVPNNILSGGPEDLNVIELLWKQDVDLGVGKEVYDYTLREELERKQEQEHLKQEEQRKAQNAAREKEERSRHLEASRWLNQNYSRDGETGEWVKRQNKTATSNEAVGVTTDQNENGDFLTLEAALDYLLNNVVNTTQESNNDGVVPAPDNFSNTFNFHNDVTELQPTITAEGLQTENISPAQSPQDLENQWFEMEQFLNGTVPEPQVPQAIAVPPTQDAMLLQEYGVTDSSKLINPIVDFNQATDSLFTNSDMPLIQNATLPAADMDYLEFGNMTMTNLSAPQESIGLNNSLEWDGTNAMNASLNWDSGDVALFDNLTTLSQNGTDDVDLRDMEDLFNSMTNASSLFTASNDTGNLPNMLMSSEDGAMAMPVKSFTEELNETFDGLEGATGGADYDSAPLKKMSRLSESSSDSGYGKGTFSSTSSSSSSYAGSPSDGNTLMNNETNSNDTEHDPHGTKALAHQVAHNHTYNTLPGHTPREVKKYAHKEPSKKGPQCRDERRAQELKIPFTIDEIVNSPVETFNDILTKHSLTEEQLTLVRDIRRRGKNKLAAQNCRKRKVGVIFTLEDEMVDLQKARDRLREERAAMEKETRMMKEKFSHLYSHIFTSLRDEHGQPYDRNQYSLQQSSDGNIFLVPRNVTTNGEMNGTHHTNGTNSGNGASKDNDHRLFKKSKSDH